MAAQPSEHSTTLHELLDPDSLLQADGLYRHWSERASTLLRTEYRPFYNQTIEVFEQVRAWRDAIQNFRWSDARKPKLWKDLLDAGFLSSTLLRCSPDGFVGDISIISPRICDAVFEDGEPSVNFAFTTVRVCLRRAERVPEGVNIPVGWTECHLLDCELFEIPHHSTKDLFDDREKIHVFYLAGMHDGHVVCQPCYIGVGTGEAYGAGPRHRTTTGRFRFYRYDVKDSFQCEHVAVSFGKTWRDKDVTILPPIPDIEAQHATVLDARSIVDPSFICLSDPKVLTAYVDRIREHPIAEMEFREVHLRKLHDDLRTGAPSMIFKPDDLDPVLRHAQDTYRWFACAWLHPMRLAAQEGISLYFRELPAYKRVFYDTMKFRQEYVPAHNGQLRGVIEVLQDAELSNRLQSRFPSAIDILGTWWREEVVKDLYASGSDPELRLQTAILIWQRMSESGWWRRAVELGYNRRFTSLEFGPSAVLGIG